MTLEIILRNNIIYDNILKHLDNHSTNRLSSVCKGINDIMNKEGYFRYLLFNCDTLENYMKSLELLEQHKRYIKTILINKDDIDTYLPTNIETKCINITPNVYLEL